MYQETHVPVPTIFVDKIDLKKTLANILHPHNSCVFCELPPSLCCSSIFGFLICIKLENALLAKARAQATSHRRTVRAMIDSFGDIFSFELGTFIKTRES